MLRLGLTNIFIFFISAFTNAQQVGFQFYQGVNKPMVYFNTGTPQQYSFVNDTRIGLWVGNLDKLSISALMGISPEAYYKFSGLMVDLPLRYSFHNRIINSFAFGPSLDIKDTRTNKYRTKTIASILGELSFQGYSSDILKIHPYFGLKLMPNSISLQGTFYKYKVNVLSFGVRIDFGSKGKLIASKKIEITQQEIESSSPSVIEYVDVIYLKNGSIIRGMIIEQVPNVQVKIKTSDGSVFVHSLDQVLKLTKEPK